MTHTYTASCSLLFAAQSVVLCLYFVSLHHIAGDLLSASLARNMLHYHYCCVFVVVIDQMMQRLPLLCACERSH